MRQDEISRIAQTCGFSREDHHAIYDMLVRFAELVAAAAKAKEREACAITAWCTGMDTHKNQLVDAREVGSLCAAAIRARGNV